MSKAFGQRLKALRTAKNFSIKEVAEAINVSPSTYRDWEYGREILGEPYFALSQKLEISLYELITGEKPSIGEALDALRSMEDSIYKLRKVLHSLE